MSAVRPPYKKLFYCARYLARRGRIFYLLLLAACVYSAYRAFTKSAWLVATIAAAAGVLAYDKLRPAARRQQSPTAPSPPGNPFSNPGIFTYSPTGFTVATTTGPQAVCWAEINGLFGSKVDLYTIDRIQLDLFHARGYLCLHEELPGWHPFLGQLAAQFPTIEPHWEIAIASLAFATNLTLLFEKAGLDLASAQRLYYTAQK